MLFACQFNAVYIELTVLTRNAANALPDLKESPSVRVTFSYKNSSAPVASVIQTCVRESEDVN